jgi:hypothetical protein
VFVGVSNTMVNGNITSGAQRGLSAAAAICSGQFGMGARMCTSMDIYNSVAKGVIKDNMTINKAWVYQAAWNTPLAGAQENLAGVSDNCASMTYPTGDRGWAGTAFAWQNSTHGFRSIKFFSGAEARCSATFPIACCK